MRLQGLELPELGKVSDAAGASGAISLDALVEGSKTSVIPQVLVGEGFGQTPCYTDPSVPRGEVQSRVPLVVDGVDVESVADERRHFLHSAFYRGLHVRNSFVGDVFSKTSISVCVCLRRVSCGYNARLYT